MGLKWVCVSRILRVERRSPLNTSVSRKTPHSDDISQQKLIVGWNELARLTKLETSSIGMVHKENVIDKLNLFQTKGFNGLAASIPFSMSTKKTTKKATAIFISHGVSLYEAFFSKLKRLFFTYDPH